MKLRTRIILLCTAIFIIAGCINNIVIWNICKNTLTDGAIKSAYADSYTVFGGFSQYVGFFGRRPDQTAVEYFFKSNRDDYTICINTDTREEYYNNTVFTSDELNDKDQKIYDRDAYFTYSLFRWEGKLIVCFSRSTDSGFLLYHLTDLSSVSQQIYMLGFEMIAISAVIFIAMIVPLYLIIKWSLTPIGKLSEKTKLISDGKYDARISMCRQDEVGLLAQDFNKMAEAVEKHTSEIKESEEKKTLFMGMLAHELKTPLTAISGYAETMQRVKLSDEDTAEALYYIKNECGRLTRLSGKIMRLLELEHGTELSLEKVTVCALFEAVRISCAGKAKENGVEIVISKSDDIVTCDIDLMTDVLINLTDNAIKASEKGSSVCLYTEKTENGFIIAIEDFGCGMPEDELNLIFDPFYMIDKSRSRKTGGTGLGLSLTSLILKQHGFPITVESQVGKGTIMRIYISITTR